MSLSIATRLRSEQPRNRSSIPSRSKRYFSSSKVPLFGPPRIIFNRRSIPEAEKDGWGVKLTTYFLCNKTNQMQQFHKFILQWNSTCFGQFVCPSSGVYSLYTQQWYMSYRFVDSVPSWSCSKAVYKPVWHTPLLSVQWINSWWWTDELPETCGVSCPNKFVKLVRLVGFITKKFVTMHGHMNVLLRYTVTWTYCYDARSHERIFTMHGHMNVLLRYTVTWTYCYDARSHESIVTMHGHMNVFLRCTVTWT
jgi:hypothetical protein